MNKEKIEYIKRDIESNDSLKNKLNNIISLIDSKEIELQISLKIIEYFDSLCMEIFDAFVCEGVKEEYSYTTFKSFYFNIFYSFLKDFFITNNKINEYCKSLDRKNYITLYYRCEDSLFIFLTNYYFNTSSEIKGRIENILKSIISYDCDSKIKEERYKKILFDTYKLFNLNKLNNQYNETHEKIKDLNKTYKELRTDVKQLRGIYFGYKRLQYTSEFYSFCEKYSRDSIIETIKDLKDNMKKCIMELKEQEKNKMIIEQNKNNMLNMTQEEFEGK